MAELVAGHDVDTVLERIVERASRAVRAPRYVLAVQLTVGAPVRVHVVGVAASAVDDAATALLAADPHWPTSWLVVDVRSGARQYGRLAACNPEGVGFLPEDRVNLTAFAELAAAALDSATAVTDARRNAETAEALLDLARAVADVTSKQDVAARLAAAVPRVIGATSASVLLWDGEQLAPAASRGLSPAVAAQFDRYTAPLVPGGPLDLAIKRGEPYFVAAADADDRLRPILEGSGTRECAVVPIQVDAELFGIVAAGVAVDIDELRRDVHLVTRLRGLASFAATAFQSAALLDEVRHQSLHDHLTGTPNARLLEDRVEQALAAARRSGRPMAVVFVDLDGFKQVNDTHGHAVGDAAVRATAQRLRLAVREVDTVARLGGDEFVVVLLDVADDAAAEGVVSSLLGALRAPMRVDGCEIRLDASVGVAIGPRDGHDSAALLKAADAAMYRAKRTR